MAGFGANLMQMLQNAIALGGALGGGNAPQAINNMQGQQMPEGVVNGATGGNITNITPTTNAPNTPTMDANGRIHQPQQATQSNGIVESALQNAQAPALAPQLAAAQEAAQAQTTPQLPQTATSSQIGMPAELQQGGSALGSGGFEAPQQQQQAPVQDKGWLDTIVQNLTGGENLTGDALKEWQKWQAVGAMGTRLGGAIAGQDSLVGQASQALNDTFSGNLSAKNLETGTANMNDYMSNALSGLAGGASSGAKGNPYNGVPSALSGTQFTNPTFSDIRTRMNKIGSF